MEQRNLNKEDIDKVRHIKGFPIAEDEYIIKLSNAPFYTACPNPFIEEFVSKFGHQYDADSDDYKMNPYTEDVAEGKHDGIYNVHSYHTKVPPKAIMTYLEHYTKPGDLVLDVFSGSGMTGVAAQLCDSGKRSAILVDLSPYATFLSSNYNTPNELTLVNEVEDILEDIEKGSNAVYQTIHVINGEVQYGMHGQKINGIIDYTVWSDVFYCPNCAHEMIFYNDALDLVTRKTLKNFKCTKCNCELSKSNILLKKEKDIGNDGSVYEYVKKIPVIINYSVGNTRYSKVPDAEDLKKLEMIQIKDWIPHDELPPGYNTEQPKRSHGMYWVNSFYTKRTQLLLGEVYNSYSAEYPSTFS